MDETPRIEFADREPDPPPEVLVSDEDRIKEREEQKRKILEEAQKILKDFGGLAANIPISNGYWDLMNQFRALHAQPLTVPSTRITEPYSQLPADALDRVVRPDYIRRDAWSALRHYDAQHPASQAALQLEIAQENDRRKTPEEETEEVRLREEAEARQVELAERQEEDARREAEIERKRLEDRLDALPKS